MPGYVRMRRDLALPIGPAPFPDGLGLEPFTAATAEACRELMNLCYGATGRAPVAFQPWYDDLISDSEYDASLMQVVTSGEALVGFCHCWTVPYVKDVVVARDFRRQGLGSAMLTAALQTFAERGARSVDLKTDVDNLSAQSVYSRLGFVIVERVDG